MKHGRVFLASLGFFTITAFLQAFDLQVPLILKYTFGFSDTVTGLTMAATSLLSFFLLPIFGILSDNRAAKSGYARLPFLTVGISLAALFMQLIPLGANLASIWAVIAGLSLTLGAVTVYRSPSVALIADITPPGAHGRASAILNFAGALGAAGLLVLSALLVPAQAGAHTNYQPLFLALGGLMLAALAVLLVFVREPKWALYRAPAPAKKQSGAQGMKAALPGPLVFLLLSVLLIYISYASVSSGFSRYAVERLHISQETVSLLFLAVLVSNAASYVVIGAFSSSFNNKTGMLCGIAGVVAAFLLLSLFTAYSPLLYACFTVLGFGWGAVNACGLPLLLHYAGGQAGRYTGYYYSAQAAAQIGTPFLAGLLLQFVSYTALMPAAALVGAAAFAALLLSRNKEINQANILPENNGTKEG